jgi:hypothetical protein
MSQRPTETEDLVNQKRDAARRARRLARGLVSSADHDRLNQFAAELDKEADTLERLAHSVSRPPVIAPPPRVQQQMQQQQQSEQSAETPAPAQQPKERGQPLKRRYCRMPSAPHR